MDSYCFNLKTASFGQSNNLRTFSYRKAALEKLFVGVTDSMEVIYVSRLNSCFYICEVTACCSRDFTHVCQSMLSLFCHPSLADAVPLQGAHLDLAVLKRVPSITQPDRRTNGLGAFAVLTAFLVKGDMANPFLSLPPPRQLPCILPPPASHGTLTFLTNHELKTKDSENAAGKMTPQIVPGITR